MPAFSDYTFRSCNAKNDIHVRRCTPDGAVRAVVQIAHGIAEHVERYDDFATYLAENGFLVVANDHLGHGKSFQSEEEKGFFAEHGGWELVVGDMRRLYEQTHQEFPDVPYFLFGHSMGSFLSRTYLIKYPVGLGGAVLCGTGQQSKAMVTGGKLLAQLEVRRHGAKYHSQKLNDIAFGSYNKGYATHRTEFDWLSRDEAHVDKYIADPLCGFLPSAGLFADMMGGIGFIGTQKNVERMKKDLPVFFIAGEKDPVGENGKGVQRAYSSFLKAGMTDVTMKLYHDCRHEILNELNRDEVMKDVLTWLCSKL